MLGKMTATVIAAALLSAVGTTSGLAVAADSDKAPPYAIEGVIDWLDSSSGAIVVDDRQFVLPANVKIHTGGKGQASTSSLRPGMRVGIRAVADGARRTVAEIWLLP